MKLYHLASGIVLSVWLAACGAATTPALPPAGIPTSPPPSPTVQPPTSAPSPDPRPVTFTSADGATLYGTLYGRGSVAIIFSNMGDKHQDSWAAMAGAVADEGYLALTYDFRYWVNGQMEEGLMSHVADDLGAAAAFAREQGVQKIVMAGASLGGMATAKAAAAGEASAVIILASPMEAPGIGLQVELAELQAIAAPKLFITSDNDGTVSPDALRQMYDLAVDPKELFVYPGMAHGTDIFNTEHGTDLQARLIAFITASAPADGSAPGAPANP